jgi:hypothetical protein
MVSFWKVIAQARRLPRQVMVGCIAGEQAVSNVAAEICKY